MGVKSNIARETGSGGNSTQRTSRIGAINGEANMESIITELKKVRKHFCFVWTFLSSAKQRFTETHMAFRRRDERHMNFQEKINIHQTSPPFLVKKRGDIKKHHSEHIAK